MNYNKIKVLVVENALAAGNLLVSYLERQGWRVDVNLSGDDVLAQTLKNDYDLVFVNAPLSSIEGVALCRDISADHPAGIVFTAATDDPVERILALEAGADAIYSQPLPMRELIAHSKALLRRVQKIKNLQREWYPGGKKNYYFHRWHIDAERERVYGPAGKVNLGHNEAAVLLALCAEAGVSVRRDVLMRVLGKPDWLPFDRTLDVLMGRLRQKLKTVVPEKSLISTQYGHGYRLNAECYESILKM